MLASVARAVVQHAHSLEDDSPLPGPRPAGGPQWQQAVASSSWRQWLSPAQPWSCRRCRRRACWAAQHWQAPGHWAHSRCGLMAKVVEVVLLPLLGTYPDQQLPVGFLAFRTMGTAPTALIQHCLPSNAKSLTSMLTPPPAIQQPNIPCCPPHSARCTGARPARLHATGAAAAPLPLHRLRCHGSPGLSAAPHEALRRGGQQARCCGAAGAAAAAGGQRHLQGRGGWLPGPAVLPGGGCSHAA